MMSKQDIIPGQIITITNVLTDEECDDYIKRSEQIGYDEAPLTTLNGFVIRKEVRNNTRVMVDDQITVNLLWQRVKNFIPAQIGSWKSIGLNERIRYYKYEPSQYFNWHWDGCFRRNNNEESILTFMIYLNDDFRGGETNFSLKYPNDDVSIKPIKGMALVFEHSLCHEGSCVRAGKKYVLRSDVMYRRISTGV